VKHIAETVASRFGYTTDVSNKKYMMKGKKNGNEEKEMELNGQIKNVEIFRYVDSLLTNTDKTSAEIKGEILLVMNFTTK
jgi:hypothetical protein